MEGRARVNLCVNTLGMENSKLSDTMTRLNFRAEETDSSCRQVAHVTPSEGEAYLPTYLGCRRVIPAMVKWADSGWELG